MRRELQLACVGAGSQQAWARQAGLSASYVSDVLSGRRDVSEAIANALGYVRRVAFHTMARD